MISQNVYDLDGQELMALDGLKFRELIGDEILLIGYNEDGSHWTQLTKADGTTVWTEDSGLIWTGSVDDYNSWTDADGKGQILVMGETPETVLTEEGFLAKNAEVQGKRYVSGGSEGVRAGRTAVCDPDDRPDETA